MPLDNARAMRGDRAYSRSFSVSVCLVLLLSRGLILFFFFLFLPLLLTPLSCLLGLWLCFLFLSLFLRLWLFSLCLSLFLPRPFSHSLSFSWALQRNIGINYTYRNKQATTLTKYANTRKPGNTSLSQHHQVYHTGRRYHTHTHTYLSTQLISHTQTTPTNLSFYMVEWFPFHRKQNRKKNWTWCNQDRVVPFNLIF